MDRRALIKGLAALAPMLGASRLFAETPKGDATKSCRLITQDIAGPYRTADVPLRSDITAGQPGTPLTLNFQVVDSFRCQPLAGALVSIWHANAGGLYSGVRNVMLGAGMAPEGGAIDTTDQNFLRGTQQTDSDGRVTFNTIFPGWYRPRATHAHIMVFPPDYGEVATTQLYFPDQVCDLAYQGEHYAKRGPNPIRTDPKAFSPNDGTDAEDLWLDLRRTANGFEASHQLGVTFYGGMFGELPEFYRQG
jgi:protocatechuate 3,4-dioxygenase beta subunit